MLIALIATIRFITFTLPESENCRLWVYAPGVSECAPCSVAVPLRDLHEVALVGWPITGRSVDTLARKLVTGREGTRDSLPFNWDGQPWTLYAITRDGNGNWSCASNWLSIGAWPVGAPLPGRFRYSSEVRWYDVLGRRVNKPTENGIFWRVGGDTLTKYLMLNGRLSRVR